MILIIYSEIVIRKIPFDTIGRVGTFSPTNTGQIQSINISQDVGADVWSENLLRHLSVGKQVTFPLFWILATASHDVEAVLSDVLLPVRHDLPVLGLGGELWSDLPVGEEPVSIMSCQASEEHILWLFEKEPLNSRVMVPAQSDPSWNDEAFETDVSKCNL